MISGPTAPPVGANLKTVQTEAPPGKLSIEADVALRFEQMLWAEMLSHAGLEDVLTKNGGEAAAAFSRFVVEEIAADIAEKHPLGLADAQSPDNESILR